MHIVPACIGMFEGPFTLNGSTGELGRRDIFTIIHSLWLQISWMCPVRWISYCGGLLHCWPMQVLSNCGLNLAMRAQPVAHSQLMDSCSTPRISPWHTGHGATASGLLSSCLAWVALRQEAHITMCMHGNTCSQPSMNHIKSVTWIKFKIWHCTSPTVFVTLCGVLKERAYGWVHLLFQIPR